MKKRIVAVVLTLAMAATVFVGCGNTEKKENNNSTSETVNDSADNTTTDEDTTEDADDGDILGDSAQYVGLGIKDLQEGRTYDITEVVKLPDYSDVTVDVDLTLGATDEEVDAYIDSVLSTFVVYNKLDKDVVENYDYVNIDYTGTMDGVTSDNFCCDDYNLGIGTGTFIPGFESGLIGAHVGDTVVLNLTFPEDYGKEELNGKDIEFTVKVNYICKKTSMNHETIDDAYIADNTVYDTVEEFRKAAKDYYEQNSSKDENTLRDKAAMAYIVDNSTINIPDGMLEDKVNQTIAHFVTQVTSLGYDFEQYINLGMQMNYEEFVKYVQDSQEESVRQELVLEALANDMGLTIDEEEFTSYIKESVSTNALEGSTALFDAYDSTLSDGELFVARTYLLTQAKKLYKESINYNVIREEE